MITSKRKVEGGLSPGKPRKIADKGTYSVIQKICYKIKPIYTLNPIDGWFSSLKNVSKYIEWYIKTVYDE